MFPGVKYKGKKEPKNRGNYQRKGRAKHSRSHPTLNFLLGVLRCIMPPYEVETMTSWADRVELEEQTEGDLPAPTEHFDERKGIKTVTEYKFNEDGKKVKVVRTFKIEKRKVAKTIATRKV